jgi:hypothetical protein
MALKFYLNKICKMDNIEMYSLKTVLGMKDSYSKFIEETGLDPDFPTLNFGNKQTPLVSTNANNLYTALGGDEEAIKNYNQGDMVGLTLNLSK